MIRGRFPRRLELAAAVGDVVSLGCIPLAATDGELGESEDRPDLEDGPDRDRVPKENLGGRLSLARSALSTGSASLERALTRAGFGWNSTPPRGDGRVPGELARREGCSA